MRYLAIVSFFCCCRIQNLVWPLANKILIVSDHNICGGFKPCFVFNGLANAAYQNLNKSSQTQNAENQSDWKLHCFGLHEISLKINFYLALYEIPWNFMITQVSSLRSPFNFIRSFHCHLQNNFDFKTKDERVFIVEGMKEDWRSF